ncbi:MAG: NAD(+) diphosphatase [Prevotella sp.]
MKKYWFVFIGNDLLLEKIEDGTYTIPYQENPPIPYQSKDNVHSITPINGKEVRTYRLSTDIQLDDRFEICNLRASFHKLPEYLYLKAGKCEEILYWDSNTCYCGVCGSKLHMHTDISKICDNCGKEIWPQLSTAVIVLIHKGDDILLVHARNFRGDYYGLVAGFVETGETLEQAVVREVREETGIEIKNIKYYASQSWPYPCGLMVGFYAEYESGDIVLQDEELSAGGWFDIHNLPAIPDKLSIARKLIDNWLRIKNIL